MEITDLKKEREQLKQRLKDIDEFFRQFQKVCTHKWKFTYSDSHYDWEECEVCEETRRS